MRLLVLNCGSSSLKFDVIDIAPGGEQSRLGAGAVERVGSEATISLDGEAARTVEAPDLATAFHAAIHRLEEAGFAKHLDAIGHRVVHGGLALTQAVLIDESVLARVREATELAPLHNRPALEVIEASRAHFGEAVPGVACFDTAFFAALPEAARTYALPHEVTQRHGIRRFGFHGLAHAHMVQRMQTLRPELSEPRLITLQLGSGCSVTASIGGRPIDTSMGFTPLEGLVMGTRSGDLDPALPLFLQSREDLSAQDVETMLNKRSGLLGVSGVSADMRDVREAAGRGDERASLAIEVFERSVAKYVGAYMALLGGADAIVFGGGIGERDAELRACVCLAFEWAGLRLDGAANRAVSGADACITASGSNPEAWVVQVDEAAVIASETARLIRA